MPAGLKDVAQLAGVSVKTVSNVVNAYPGVAPHTRAKVEQAIRQLGYQPNLAARRLRNGRSDVIALAVPELEVPYFSELASLVVQEAQKRSWTVLIEQTNGVAQHERHLVAGLRRHLIDGLIFSPLALAGEELLEELRARRDKTPMVLLGERIWDGPADHVAIDNTTAAREVTEHLFGLGRRRIAAIGAQDNPAAVTARQRLEGYHGVLEQTGHGYDPSLVAEVSAFHRADGAKAMAWLLDSGNPPDAVFCFNDLLALGAIRTLLDRGYAVPGDVAVAGFDNIEDGQFSTPTLTTVALDTGRIAALSVDLLAERLDQATLARAEQDGEPVAPPREIRVAHRLVARESTLGRLAVRAQL